MTVHGDDFTCAGPTAELKWLKFKVEQEYEITSEMLGPEDGMQQEIRVLNRVISWQKDGITYEPDQRHAEIAISELGLTGAKAAPTPGAKDDLGKASVPKEAGGVELEDESPEMAPAEASQYRGIAARLNYLAQDRADIQYACKEASRRMSKPCRDDWMLLKRIGRYLIGVPRLIQTFEWQGEESTIRTYSDSDWAGCRSTCRSTSGGCMKLGTHVLKTWSSTQATVALSSAEAELYALTKAASQTLGIMSLLNDFNVETKATLYTDASAAIGIVRRAGLGKQRHLNVRYLWLQDAVKQREMELEKVHGLVNPADLFTKCLAAPIALKHLRDLRLRGAGGRAATAPECAMALRPERLDDEWVSPIEGHTIERRHRQPRRELFTPRRVAGAPPCKLLAAVRVTEGIFTKNGQAFRRVDHWTCRATAHMELSDDWTGSTKFLLRSEELGTYTVDPCEDV